MSWSKLCPLRRRGGEGGPGPYAVHCVDKGLKSSRDEFILGSLYEAMCRVLCEINKIDDLSHCGGLNLCT